MHALLHKILARDVRHNTHISVRTLMEINVALGFPHYTCGVAIGTVAVGNDIQLF